MRTLHACSILDVYNVSAGANVYASGRPTQQSKSTEHIEVTHQQQNSMLTLCKNEAWLVQSIIALS